MSSDQDFDALMLAFVAERDAYRELADVIAKQRDALLDHPVVAYCSNCDSTAMVDVRGWCNTSPIPELQKRESELRQLVEAKSECVRHAIVHETTMRQLWVELNKPDAPPVDVETARRNARALSDRRSDVIVALYEIQIGGKVRGHWIRLLYPNQKFECDAVGDLALILIAAYRCGSLLENSTIGLLNR